MLNHLLKVTLLVKWQNQDPSPYLSHPKTHLFMLFFILMYEGIWGYMTT